MPRASSSPSARPVDLRIRYPHAGRVELTSRTLFSDPGSPFCRRFLGRLFSVAEVESLTIGRAGAEIRYVPGRIALPQLVRRIAAALGGTGARSVPTELLYLRPPPGLPLRVRRYGHVLSTWDVRHSLPGRLRISHPYLRRRRGVAEALVEELRAVPGVLACRIGAYTGSLLVLHDPRRLGRDALLLLCEVALHKADAREMDVPSLAKLGVGSALLGLAVTGHFFYTPLLAACATLLVAANVHTFRRAWKALRAGSLDVDVVYGTLLILTLLSGDFLSIAFMAWSVAAWPLLLERRLATTRQALAGEPRRFASLVRVQRSGRELAVPMSSLKAGDVTVVKAGAVLAADGVVLEGAAAVDERRITGESGLADKGPGQPVYAGGRVVTGRLVIEVTRVERDAIATEVRRRLTESARVEPAGATAGVALARRAAPPVIALSALGALTGGLGTAIAVLAPNYSAAPGLSDPLDRSATLMACANAGVLVRSEAALLRLGQADTLVIEAGIDKPGTAALLDGLRARGIAPILLAAPRPGAGAAQLLRRLRRQGSRAAFVGRGDDLAAFRAADVAIAWHGPATAAVDVADVVLVSQHLVTLLELIDLSRLHAREIRLSRRLGLWPNLLALGGAFVLGFSSLHAVFLTNVGALAVYGRGSKRLGDAEDRRSWGA